MKFGTHPYALPVIRRHPRKKRTPSLSTRPPLCDVCQMPIGPEHPRSVCGVR